MFVEWLVAPERIAGAYLAGVSFTLTASLGAFVLSSVFELSGASWAIALRRLFEAMSASLPLALALVVPLVVEPAAFYPWARGAIGEGGGLIHDPHYFGPIGFAIRVIACVAAIVLLEEIVRWRSFVDDARRVPTRDRIGRGLSGFALVLVAFVGTLALQDLFMSANGTWSSDLYGLYCIVGGFATAVGALAVAARVTVPRLELNPSHASALGRTAIVGISLWAYLAFSLFILTWLADLPREVPFYTERAYGWWRPLFILLCFAHFVVPLLLLLPRASKRYLGYVATVGGLLVAAHALDSYWLVMPAFAARANPLDLGPMLLTGGLAALLAMHRFRRHAPLPVRDPTLASALAYESK
jgi:hypothetical protein